MKSSPSDPGPAASDGLLKQLLNENAFIFERRLKPDRIMNRIHTASRT